MIASKFVKYTDIAITNLRYKIELFFMQINFASGYKILCPRRY
jgi:hypothetical protein